VILPLFFKYITPPYLFTPSPISMQIHNMPYKSDQVRQETKLIFNGLGAWIRCKNTRNKYLFKNGFDSGNIFSRETE